MYGKRQTQLISFWFVMRLEIKLINYQCNNKSMDEKKCALCNNVLPNNPLTGLCSDCLTYADCCVGLEKIDDL